MRKLISIADYIVPNYTEAVYLAGMEYKKDSTESAMQTVKRMIERNVDNFDKFRGIPVETCLEVTDV